MRKQQRPMAFSTYVVGSHSAKRNDCGNNPDSRHVIRFRVDPKTGRALRNARGTLVGYADTDRLWSTMAAMPELQAHVGDSMCLGLGPRETLRILYQVSEGMTWMGIPELVEF